MMPDPRDTDPLWADDALWDPQAAAWVPRQSPLLGFAVCGLAGLVIGVVLTALVAFGWVATVHAAAPRPAQTTSRDVSGLSAGPTTAPQPAIPAAGLERNGAPASSASGNLAAAPTSEIGTAIASGIASWYDNGPGFYAAVPSWRFGDRSYRVRVCRGDDAVRCVEVRVGDCLCGRTDRLIDLSADAFRRLAPLSFGVLVVTVEDARPGITPPPTDVGPNG